MLGLVAKERTLNTGFATSAWVVPGKHFKYERTLAGQCGVAESKLNTELPQLALSMYGGSSK